MDLPFSDPKTLQRGLESPLLWSSMKGFLKLVEATCVWPLPKRIFSEIILITNYQVKIVRTASWLSEWFSNTEWAELPIWSDTFSSDTIILMIPWYLSGLFPWFKRWDTLPDDFISTFLVVFNSPKHQAPFNCAILLDKLPLPPIALTL